MALKESAISGFFWKFLERGGSQLVALIVQIVMARFLVPEDFGLLAVVLVFVNLSNVVVQSGLSTSLVQAREVSEADLSTVFWASLAVSLALWAALSLAAPAIGAAYGSASVAGPLRALGALLVLNALNSVQLAIVSREMAFRKTFVATLAAVLCSGALGVGLALAGAGLWALVGQQLCYQAVNRRALALPVRWRPRAVFSWGLARRHYRFGWKLLASGLLDQGYQGLSDLVVGARFSTGELGYVSQGKKYPAALGSMLDGAIQPVMLSAVARSQDDPCAVRRLVRRALKTSTFLVFPAMALFALVAEPLVLLLLGERWLPTVPFLQMYCLVYALLPVHTTNLQALNGVGRSDLFLRLEVAKKVLGVAVLCLTAFAIGDVYAVVAGYMLTGVVSTFINAWPSRRVLGYGYAEQVRDVVPALLLSLASAALAWPLSLLGLVPVAQVLLQALTMPASYLILARLFRVEELEYLTSTAREMLASRKGARPR